MISNQLPTCTGIYLDCLTEDMLWKIAMDERETGFVRQEAMQRWLHPADYGYSWACERPGTEREAARKHSEVTSRELAS